MARWAVKVSDLLTQVYVDLDIGAIVDCSLNLVDQLRIKPGPLPLTVNNAGALVLVAIAALKASGVVEPWQALDSIIAELKPASGDDYDGPAPKAKA